MNESARLGRILGIPVGLHWSLGVVFVLLTWSLAAGYFPDEYPGLSTGAHWLIALATSALFFGAILLHELGHAYVAKREQLPVEGITLFAFGGIARLAREPRSPGAEFRVAAAGPAVSLALAAGFGALYLLDRGQDVLAAPSLWLMRTNLALALFNLLPGFPLDGGRLLRAAVWRRTGSFHRATRIAALTGQVAAFGLIGWGALTILDGRFVNGVWLVFIGWFLQNAAAVNVVQSTLQELLRGITVAQVMDRDAARVPSRLRLRQLVDDHVLTGGGRTFVVADDDRPRGMLTLRDVTKIPRDRWEWASVTEVMVPWARLVRVEPSTPLLDALQRMDEGNVAQVPVVTGDDLVGVLSREHVLRYVRSRAELGV